MSMRGCFMPVAMLFCAKACAAPAASIELLPATRATGDMVTLGELARLQSTDLALMRALVALPVGAAPSAGQTSRVTRDALADWVGRQDALAGAVLAWSGAAESRVARAGTQVDGAEIGKVALAELRRWMTAYGISGEVLVASTPRDVHVTAADVRLLSRAVQAAHLRRRMIVWVDLWSGSRRIRTVPVALEVQLHEPPLRADAGLVRAGREGPGTALAHPPGLADRVLAVQRGEWAALRSVSGAIVLESRVQVLQDGRAGERVRVRQQGATGMVFARVLERGLLELAP